MTGSYFDRGYCITVQEGADSLTLRKSSGSDWCHLDMDTNDSQNGRINIRSRDMAEQLATMLHQMLRADQ